MNNANASQHMQANENAFGRNVGRQPAMGSYSGHNRGSSGIQAQSQPNQYSQQQGIRQTPSSVNFSNSYHAQSYGAKRIF